MVQELCTSGTKMNEGKCQFWFCNFFFNPSLNVSIQQNLFRCEGNQTNPLRTSSNKDCLFDKNISGKYGFLELIFGVYVLLIRSDPPRWHVGRFGFLVASGRAGRSRRRVHYFLERNWAGSNGFLQTLKRLATKVSSLVGRVSNSSDWAMTFRVKTQNFPPPPQPTLPSSHLPSKRDPRGANFSPEVTFLHGNLTLRAMPHEECRNH